MKEKKLTKARFWDRLFYDFPEAAKHFSRWIDNYKIEVGWTELFGDQLKFHDLPDELQFGVLRVYFLEAAGGKEAVDKDSDGIAAEIAFAFQRLEITLQF